MSCLPCPTLLWGWLRSVKSSFPLRRRGGLGRVTAPLSHANPVARHAKQMPRACPVLSPLPSSLWWKLLPFIICPEFCFRFLTGFMLPALPPVRQSQWSSRRRSLTASRQPPLAQRNLPGPISAGKPKVPCGPWAAVCSAPPSWPWTQPQLPSRPILSHRVPSRPVPSAQLSTFSSCQTRSCSGNFAATLVCSLSENLPQFCSVYSVSGKCLLIS